MQKIIHFDTLRLHYVTLYTFRGRKQDLCRDVVFLKRFPNNKSPNGQRNEKKNLEEKVSHPDSPFRKLMVPLWTPPFALTEIKEIGPCF